MGGGFTFAINRSNHGCDKSNAGTPVRATVVLVVVPAFYDESGVGFAAHLAENSTPLWSHHSIPRSDETWLPEWSGNLGEVQRCAVRSRGLFGNPQFCICAP